MQGVLLEDASLAFAHELDDEGDCELTVIKHDVPRTGRLAHHACATKLAEWRKYGVHDLCVFAKMSGVGYLQGFNEVHWAASYVYMSMLGVAGAWREHAYGFMRRIYACESVGRVLECVLSRTRMRVFPNMLRMIIWSIDPGVFVALHADGVHPLHYAIRWAVTFFTQDVRPEQWRTLWAYVFMSLDDVDVRVAILSAVIVVFRVRVCHPSGTVQILQTLQEPIITVETHLRHASALWSSMHAQRRQCV